MTEKSATPWTTVLTALLAVVSLTFNVVQYLRSESARTAAERRSAAEESRKSSPDCWLAFGTDRAVVDLFRGNEALGGGKAPTLAQVSPFYEDMRRVFQASSSRRYSFREKLTGAFFVVHNVDTRRIHDVRLTIGSATEPLVGPLSIEPNETIFVPLDFLPAGDARTEPDLPPRVTVHYQEGSDVVVEPSATRVSLLQERLVRALISHRAKASPASAP